MIEITQCWKLTVQPIERFVIYQFCIVGAEAVEKEKRKKQYRQEDPMGAEGFERNKWRFNHESIFFNSKILKLPFSKIFFLSLFCISGFSSIVLESQ
jgi:hypothetical protein